jgi:hypothetical protein
MSISMVIRRTGNPADARLRKEAAAIWKKHGAVAFRFGSYHTGAHAGQILVVITFPDWVTYGRAMQSISEDADYKKMIGEVDKISQIQERYLSVTEEL